MKKTLLGFILVFIFMFPKLAFSTSVTISIPDDKIDRIINAVCAEYNYNMTKLPEETKSNFVKRMIKSWLRDVTLTYEYNKEKEEITIESLDLD